MERIERIRLLNDRLRWTMQGGKVMMTCGVEALGQRAVLELLHRVRIFAQFDKVNDPHHEHDFGSIEQDGTRFFWKIDYYDPTLSFGSADPADPAVTLRVLTLMLAEEY